MTFYSNYKECSFAETNSYRILGRSETSETGLLLPWSNSGIEFSFRGNRAEIRFADYAGAAPVYVKVFADKRETRCGLYELADKLVAVAVHYAEMHLRVILYKFRYPFRGNVRRGAFHKPDRDSTLHALTHGYYFRRRLVGKAQKLLCAAVEQLSRLGQLKMPLAADKKHGVKLLLKPLYLAAQRRLAHAQLFGGFRYIQFLRDRDKVG